MTYARYAHRGEIGDLLPLCRAFHAESPHHSKLSFSDERVVQLIEAAIGNPDWLAIVAQHDEAGIVGMGLFYCMPAFFSTELEVGDLTFWVHPDHRGGRAALVMMQMLTAWKEQKGAARLNIGVTTGINHDQALRFFGRFGLRPHGTLMVL